MQYRYAKEQVDYSDFASGRVFYSLPGYPAFPVRLASEIFQRCVASRATIYGNSSPCSLYDPCCGAAYQLSVLAYLHGETIREVVGSDVDEKAVALAKRNLGLLGTDGLEQRLRELSEMFAQYGKESHQEALRSAAVLKKKLSSLREQYPLKTNIFRASATDKKEVVNHITAHSVDIVFTDVPYGQHSHWQDAEFSDRSNPLRLMLDTLLDVLSTSSIVAIASDKKQKAMHEKYERIDQFQVGKRRIVILKPV